MKYLFPGFLAVVLALMVISSCSPTPSEPDKTELIHYKYRGNTTNTGGILKSTADTNLYGYSLSPCGCGFEFVVENADTSSVLYNVGNIAVRDVKHFIKAFPRSGLATGTYYGWLAVRTLKPDTEEDFRDTLRDTVMIP